MINALSVTGFKCLAGQKILLRDITLLTGVNGSGKSSIIQSLLLARIAALAVRDGRAIVPLNGPFGLTLGQVEDVVSFIPDIWPEIRFTLETEGPSEAEGASAELVLAARAGTDRYLRVEQSNPELSRLAGGQFGQFTYLAAEREGPRDFQTMQSAPVEMLEIGARGEYLADVLQTYEREPVFPALEHPRARGLRLAKQAEAWLGSFVSGIEIRVESAPTLGTVAVRFKHEGPSSEWLRPANVGFGITQSLPVIVAGLLGKPGCILIVDSPEAHLHPRAQSRMGAFLGRVAAAGIQVVIETHSDHILNGVRLAVVDTSHPLRREQVAINHLTSTELGTSVESIFIDIRGALSQRPSDFFDQSEKDIAAIIKHRRT